jgi:hypothetical protein
LIICLFIVPVAAVHADTWTIATLPDWVGDWVQPRDIIFTFENDTLSLNTEAISTEGGSSCEVWQLKFSGNWAACGTIDGAGNLLSDPYATFVYEARGGHIQWAPNTPSGYTAPLMLGFSFSGDGAATYEDYGVFNYETGQYEPTGRTTTGTLVQRHYLALRSDEMDIYDPLTHTFQATPVPEPPSILALMCGFVGLVGYMGRSKRSILKRR